MPHTYIRAVGPEAAGTLAPVLVSWSRTGPPQPGRVGRGGAGQRVTPGRLPAGSRGGRPEPLLRPFERAGSERGPGDGRPPASRPRVATGAEQPPDAVQRPLHLLAVQ